MTDQETLRSAYGRIKAEATQLAGGLESIPQRAMLLHDMYLDSGENHPFPQIAAHGALWAYRYFEVGGSLGRFIARRYFYNSRERAYRLGLLQSFAEGFRTVNRTVYIDTYSNYYFTRQYGTESGAEQIIPPPLLQALNLVHAARAAGESLSPAERRFVFQQSFQWEQELTVAPGVKAAVDQFQCRILKALCLMPLVRFAYFPPWRYFLFRNFADKAERIAKGMRAYEMARRAGWQKVKDSMRAYGLLPPAFFRDPRGFTAQLRRQAPCPV
jgi:hypothetical protein